MTLEELIEDLESQLSVTYFKSSFTSGESRRSFNDLYKYYSQFGVTEKLLMQAIKKIGLRAYYCGIPKRFVFFKHPSESSDHNKLFVRQGHGVQITEEFGGNNFGKYTGEYLQQLFEECDKESLE